MQEQTQGMGHSGCDGFLLPERHLEAGAGRDDDREQKGSAEGFSDRLVCIVPLECGSSREGLADDAS
jgi:hypothetical protein